MIDCKSQDKYLIFNIIETNQDTIINNFQIDTLILTNTKEKRTIDIQYPNKNTLFLVNEMTDIEVIFSKNKNIVYAHNNLLDKKTNEVIDAYLIWENDKLKKLSLLYNNKTIQYKIYKKI